MYSSLQRFEHSTQNSYGQFTPMHRYSESAGGSITNSGRGALLSAGTSTRCMAGSSPYGSTVGSSMRNCSRIYSRVTAVVSSRVLSLADRSANVNFTGLCMKYVRAAESCGEIIRVTVSGGGIGVGGGGPPSGVAVGGTSGSGTGVGSVATASSSSPINAPTPRTIASWMICCVTSRGRWPSSLGTIYAGNKPLGPPGMGTKLPNGCPAAPALSPPPTFFATSAQCSA